MTRSLLHGGLVVAAGLAINELVASVPEWHAAAHVLYVLALGGLVVGLGRSVERERALARTDVLTGVPNRRTFVEATEARIRRMRRDASPFTVLYLDVDGFKRMNDRFGHAAGDAVLKGVGATLVRSVRACDTVARLGGDEFAVLLEGAEAEPVIARTREALRQLARAHGWDVGFSIGAVTFRQAPRSTEEVLGRTDAAMYAAKSRGDGIVFRVA